MGNDYFYSKSTGLYVAREPLKIDARVIKAAVDGGVKLRWSDEGWINSIVFLEAIYLLRNLGGTMMTMREYWLILNDAKEAGDADMVAQLQSDHYAEWLNTVFEKKEVAIENVRATKQESGYTYQGDPRSIQMPYGHPGWFNAEEVDLQAGLPLKAELNREKYSTTWKYWSFCDYSYVAAAVRGWVTSVGKPSLDLGIPINAPQPNLLIRECRKELPYASIDPEISERARQFISDFQTRVQNNDYAGLFQERAEFLEFVRQYGSLFSESQETKIYKIREKLREILGILYVYAKRKDDTSSLEIARTARAVRGVTQETVRYEDFVAFVEASRARLQRAIKECRPIVFVTGHKNPDTDTVISTLAEAYRNHLCDGHVKTYIPIVQGSRMPDEIAKLLGDRLAGGVIFTNEPAYKEIANSGQARWIMVDHSLGPEIQKFVISIVDHHIPSQVALRQDIPKTIEMIGSTCALIVQRFYGLGLNIPAELAKIFYGTTLMDTENRSPYKMTARDVLIMDDLKEIAGIQSDGEFYHDLMSALLNTDDAESLFGRDYKEDWIFFGFAVAKVKHVFDGRGNVLKPGLLKCLVALARQNNQCKNLPLTLIKVVDYLDDNSTVNRERVYLIFNEQVFSEFKEGMFRLLETIIRSTFKGKALVSKTDQFIEFWGVGDQLSRKRIVPILEPVATAFNRYFYSPSTGLYAKREFLKNSQRVREAAKKCGIKLSWDSQGRINHITYGEAIRLLGQLEFTAPSLPQYWVILNDAKIIRDQQMVRHLQSDGFVEFLHTVIENGRWVVNRPEIVMSRTSFEYEGLNVEVGYGYHGTKQELKVPEGKPGLISPDEIDPNSGLPSIVHSPDIYDDPTLWRYWSPDAQKNVATRGYIFLLGQPALDLKIHLSESFQCLGVRPCCRNVEMPQMEIIADENGVSLTIWEEGEKLCVREADLFKDIEN